MASINLATGITTFILVLARVVPPWAQAHYKINLPSEDWSTLTLNDPKIGSVLPGLSMQGFGRVVLVVSDCGECNSSKVATFAATPFPSNFHRTVLIANEISLEEARDRFGHYRNIEFGVMSDSVKKSWNISFVPRVYQMDIQNRLRFIQPPSYSFGQAFWAIQKVAK